MDVLKPLRQGGCKSALARNVRFSHGGRTIARFPGNLCDRNPGVRLEVSSERSLLWRYAGCYLGHNKTNCGAEVIKKTSSAPKVARGATLCNVRFSCVGNALARFLGKQDHYSRADKMFATNENKSRNKPQQTRAPQLLDHGRSEAGSLWWRLTRSLQQITTNQSPKMLEHETRAPRWWNMSVQK